jgi:hypothetical protein
MIDTPGLMAWQSQEQLEQFKTSFVSTIPLGRMGTNRGATTGAVISKHIEHVIHFQCLHVPLCSLVVCKCRVLFLNFR